jgi:transcriptional regulator with XRE-family HTH domain
MGRADALFAYRIRRARLDGGYEQGAFVEGSGVTQQPLSEWERGERVHTTTAMLHTAAELLSTEAARLLHRPDSAHTEAGRSGRPWRPRSPRGHTAGPD